MAQLSEQPADVLERIQGTGGGVLHVHVAIFVTIVAIVVGFAAPASANDRPSDPFGNHTIKLNNETPLVEMWESLRDQMLLDKVHFHSCNRDHRARIFDCAAGTGPAASSSHRVGLNRKSSPKRRYSP